MAIETSLEKRWGAPPSTPWLGEVLLGAAGAVCGDLPELKLRPPGGIRTSAQREQATAALTQQQQKAVINPSAQSAQDNVGLPKAKRAVVVLIDGLGWHNLHTRSDLAPFMMKQFTHVKGQSTHPSTTAANIPFLGTGVHPGQTAMAGYTVRNPETGKRMNLISWAGGGNPLDWQRVPTIFERMGQAEFDTAHVSTWRFEQSALTQAALRGATYYAAETLDERVTTTVQLMREGRATLAYLYWADLDAVGHLRGWKTPEWDQELSNIDHQLTRLVQDLPADTLVIVTADHGMIDVPRGPSRVYGGQARIDLSAHPTLVRDVDMVAGENRFLHLYTKNPEDVADRWRAFFEDRAVVFTKSEALTQGIYGPVRADVSPVLGDVSVAVLGDLSVGDKRVISESMFYLPGLHGSLTEWERAVPILSLVTG